MIRCFGVGRGKRTSGDGTAVGEDFDGVLSTSGSVECHIKEVRWTWKSRNESEASCQTEDTEELHVDFRFGEF